MSISNNKIFKSSPHSNILPSEKLYDPKVISALKSRDKDMSHWFKFTTNDTRMPNGGKYQIHGYMNKKKKKLYIAKGVDKYPNLEI